MIGDSPVAAGGAAAMRMGEARLPPVCGDDGPVPSIAGAVAATNCATARPAGPSDASWRRWPGVSWLRAGAAGGTGPGRRLVAARAGDRLEVLVDARVAGWGARDRERAGGERQRGTGTATTVSRHALTPATRGSCRCRPQL